MVRVTLNQINLVAFTLVPLTEHSFGLERLEPVLTGFIGFLPGFSRFFKVFTEFCFVSPRLTKLLPGLTGFDWV